MVFFWSAGIHQVSACLWDRDTLDAENSRFPEIEDVITGNFPRHSTDFYTWRKGNCEQQLAKDPSQAALYDDLAVAQHKLGDQKAAIATMMAKEKIKPGLYETYSNLGTFWIYAGDLQQSLVWIDKALAVNPDAHFGREKYQRWLVEWVLAGKPAAPPVQKVETLLASGFAAFVLKKEAEPGEEPELVMDEVSRLNALKGVSGMMRFADFDNPLLLEALGDILCQGAGNKNAIHLACQAYLHAASRVPAPEKKALVEKINAIGRTVSSFNPASEAKDLKKGLQRGQKLAGATHDDEVAWIKAGKDASAEFTREYLKP
ncbi:hypothetical protein KBB96_18115 [Luteolibacter ambystomatis]|uniref:Tetratricopeptide repeat protein n=1 Tax=Luteolibacter ambystomatis TaxID=2824561 RepID=A0A975G7I0_9BACT|nr:hypothetical protein [Luteolibacter ambystomatis]QUE50764.1 hypothetical protein KBB96_18115 [Luteolibacter ambystomatis]